MNNDTSKRLEILKGSLAKKEEIFSQRINSHFDSVRSANGQPLNDKRNGAATLNRWEKQNDAIRNQQKEVEITERAIEREQSTIAHVNTVTDKLPTEITLLIESGELIQWRKYPNTFFVAGIDKARIVWDMKKKVVAHKYTNTITDPEQRKTFASLYNNLNKQLNN